MVGDAPRTEPGYAYSLPTRLPQPVRTCRLCGAALPSRWLENQLGDQFCMAHQGGRTCRLCSAPLPAVPDTAHYCRDCAATAVTTRDDLRQALPTVRAVLHGMGLRMSHPVRIKLVSEAELAKTALSTQDFTSGMTLLLGGTAQAVGVLVGLPLAQFGATVAHESMHVWLSQRGFPDLPLEVEEGLCEIAAYEWARRQPDQRTRLVAMGIADSTDPVYGDGFRAARAALAGRGMRALLHHVRTHGRLP
jgi:hypothetical protein